MNWENEVEFIGNYLQGRYGRRFHDYEKMLNKLSITLDVEKEAAFNTVIACEVNYRECSLEEYKESFLRGLDETNSVVVQFEMVSKWHVRCLEFVLVDSSADTYIVHTTVNCYDLDLDKLDALRNVWGEING